jgi:hypothetical protein
MGRSVLLIVLPATQIPSANSIAIWAIHMYLYDLQINGCKCVNVTSPVGTHVKGILEIACEANAPFSTQAPDFQPLETDKG